jgi:hypothetical protein
VLEPLDSSRVLNTFHTYQLLFSAKMAHANDDVKLAPEDLSEFVHLMDSRECIQQKVDLSALKCFHCCDDVSLLKGLLYS